MGVDYNIYLGAYLVVKMGQQKISRIKRICPSCEIKYDSEFCPTCGVKIIKKEFIQTEEPNYYDIIEDHPKFEDDLRWVDIDDDEKGSIILISYGDKCGTDIEYNGIWDIKEKEELTEFSKKHSNIISFLTKKAKHIELKHGVISWYS